jgi:UDP-N-acetyl-D-galactosamine dehydrogenase
MESIKRPTTIAIVGLGYVGLSLAVALASKFAVRGVDIDATRVRELSAGRDRNGMFLPGELLQPTLRFSSTPDPLATSDVVIVAVPTPVDEHDAPDLTALSSVSTMVGKHLKPGMIVVFESTVYPGCTEEECIPLLEKESGLKAHQDFGVAYSPERIDPGDTSRTLSSVMKVVSAGDPATLEVIAGMYGEVVVAGIHQAPTIRTAEAAKVIENIQRDLNIALMNELSMLFRKMDLNTADVLEAAGTKWNFAKYYPGLVGGHCIPVDPFYLVHKARQVGYDPQVILAGRRVNDSMASYVAQESATLLETLGGTPKSARALVMGLTFKEDVRDTRNAQAAVIVDELAKTGFEVWTSDPLLDAESQGPRFLADPFTADQQFDLVVLAVPHAAYRQADAEQFVALLGDPPGAAVFADLRGTVSAAAFDRPNTGYWTL